MSLIISSQGFSSGVTPKTSQSVVFKKSPPDSGVKNQAINNHIKVDSSYLEVVKIIPEEETNGGTNYSSDKSSVSNRTNRRIIINTDELVAKIIDPKTGEDTAENLEINQ